MIAFPIRYLFTGSFPYLESNHYPYRMSIESVTRIVSLVLVIGLIGLVRCEYLNYLDMRYSWIFGDRQSAMRYRKYRELYDDLIDKDEYGLDFELYNTYHSISLLRIVNRLNFMELILFRSVILSYRYLVETGKVMRERTVVRRFDDDTNRYSLKEVDIGNMRSSELLTYENIVSCNERMRKINSNDKRDVRSRSLFQLGYNIGYTKIYDINVEYTRHIILRYLGKTRRDHELAREYLDIIKEKFCIIIFNQLTKDRFMMLINDSMNSLDKLILREDSNDNNNQDRSLGPRNLEGSGPNNLNLNDDIPDTFVWWNILDPDSYPGITNFLGRNSEVVSFHDISDVSEMEIC